jgi:hypothetical protein
VTGCHFTGCNSLVQRQVLPAGSRQEDGAEQEPLNWEEEYQWARKAIRPWTAATTTRSTPDFR